MADRAKKCASGFAAAVFAATLLAAAPQGRAAEPGFLGMQVQGMSPATGEALNLNSANGILVRDVAVGGPADQAGIKRGDLILKFAGQAIDTFERMVKVAGATHPGQDAKVELLREGKPVTLTMKMGAWTETWRMGAGAGAIASHAASGLTLASLTEKLRKGFGLRWGTLGVVVTLVNPDRVDIGLQRGDVIVQVNQDEVWKPEQVIERYDAAKAAARKELLLLVERVNGFHFVLVPVR